jgi:type III secretion protein J
MRRLWIVVVLAIGCSTPIQHGLDESAANEIVTSLERAGVGANKSREDDGAFAVTVASADAVRALEFMRAMGLPRDRRAGFGEIYKQPSLLPTPTEERARYIDALAGEIARTLENVEGVASARVHLVLAEPDLLAPDGKPRIPAQAAVLLKARGRLPAPISESDVQKLVAGSVPGLAQAAVAVVVTSSPEAAAAQGTGLVALGPLRVSPGSRSTLIAAGIAACALIVLLAVLLLMMAKRLAATQRKN